MPQPPPSTPPPPPPPAERRGSWWPLLLLAGFAAVVGVAAHVVFDHRDYGSGLWAARPGPEHASAWLQSGLGLAWRLQRGSLVSWTIGMFLGGAGLADIMIYCRDKIYPLGLPNGLAHVITGFAVFLKLLLGMKSRHFPPDPKPLAVSVLGEALRNAEKHARPTDVRIAITNLDGAFALEVRNDGIGDVAGAGAGLGLRLAAYESMQRGGMLEYGPESGEWRVRLVLPASDVEGFVAGVPGDG